MAGGFSASSSLTSGPPGIHASDVKTASNKSNLIFATYTTPLDLRVINKATDSRIDRGELERGKLMTLRNRSTT